MINPDDSSIFHSNDQSPANRYPGPTLHALEMLQQPRFRKEILIPDVVARMVEAGFTASTAGLGEISPPPPPPTAATAVDDEEQEEVEAKA